MTITRSCTYAALTCLVLSALACSTPKKVAHEVKTFDTTYQLPEGWHRSGNSPYRYAMGIDKGSGRTGGNAATIKCITEPKGFGTLMQSCTADKYLGKRIRLSGYIKSKDVTRWAAFWLRVDDSLSKYKVAAFDNMYDRPVKGTTDWKKYELVLDVPPRADRIAYGALVDGPGQIWFDELNLEIVDKSVLTTRGAQEKPTNMNFDK